MVVQLARGEFLDDEGNQRWLFSEGQAREMWSPQTIRRVSEPHPALAALKPHFSSYGLGWGLSDYRGHLVVSHTGGLPGFVSRVTMVPDARLGVAVLTSANADDARARQ